MAHEGLAASEEGVYLACCVGAEVAAEAADATDVTMHASFEVLGYTLLDKLRRAGEQVKACLQRQQLRRDDKGFEVHFENSLESINHRLQRRRAFRIRTKNSQSLDVKQYKEFE
jgi:hypothetical protein